MALWSQMLRKHAVAERDHDPTNSSEVRGWTVGTRPSHDAHLRRLHLELAREVFVESPPERRAYFWVADLLNQQLAAMQQANLLDAAGERRLRMPFALGYIFGVAACYSDECGVRRPSAEADRLVVLAHRDVLGPLSQQEVARLSADAWSREFGDGMEAGVRDANSIWQRRTLGAGGLMEFVVKPRMTQGVATRH